MRCNTASFLFRRLLLVVDSVVLAPIGRHFPSVSCSAFFNPEAQAAIGSSLPVATGLILRNWRQFCAIPPAAGLLLLSPACLSVAFTLSQHRTAVGRICGNGFLCVGHLRHPEAQWWGHCAVPVGREPESRNPPRWARHTGQRGWKAREEGKRRKVKCAAVRCTLWLPLTCLPLCRPLLAAVEQRSGAPATSITLMLRVGSSDAFCSRPLSLFHCAFPRASRRLGCSPCSSNPFRTPPPLPLRTRARSPLHLHSAQS
jgi:hypothetical protein